MSRFNPTAASPPRTLDPASIRAFDGQQTALKQLYGNPILNGNLLEQVELGAGVDTNVQHGLGRAYRGWFICDTTAAATIYRPTSTMDTALFLPLHASIATTVSVWIF